MFILGIHDIGHDLDSAQAKGFSEIFPGANHVWCCQHLKNRDSEKFRSLGANKQDTSRILADIYGSQNEVLYENGLADSVDAQELSEKVGNLRTIWESLVPGFHSWFMSKRVSIFEECLAFEARQKLNGQSRFYTNALENKHKMQKKALFDAGISKEVVTVSRELYNWGEEYQRESERSIRHLESNVKRKFG